MSWNQNGGGWKGGGGPWGSGPSGGGSGQQPDLEDMLRRSQDRIRQAMPGGLGTLSTLVLVLVAGVAIAYFGFSVPIKPDEIGIVQRFGTFDRSLSNGLNFRWPYPIEEVTVVPYTRQNRVEIGFSTQTSGGYSSPRNIEKPDESLMLTGDENIVDVNFNVFWNVKDPGAFLFNVRHPNDNDPNAQVKAVAESAMREVIGKREIQPILTKSRQEVEEAVKVLLQQILDSYRAGILITQVNLQKVDPPSEVIASFRDVQAARADQDRRRNEADNYANGVVPAAKGEAQKIILGAQGYREQTVAESRGRTERFLKIYQEYAKAPEVTRRRIYLETMEHVLGSVDKVIIDDKAAGSGVVPYLPLGDSSRNKPQDNGGAK